MKMCGSVSYCLLRILRTFIDFMTNLVFGLIYGKSKELPPITNHILLNSASKLALKIRKKELKSVDLVEAYVCRIKDVQPCINAVVDERYEEALQEAREVDDVIESGKFTEEQLRDEKPFFGVPFSCKEAIGVRGMSFTSGFALRRGIKAEQDSGVVIRLKKAGAIPIVSTNVCELCMWWETGNSIYGTTKNPFDTRKISGGSSGGEGALIGSAGSVFGVGNDVGGSIRIPAFMNGIFGHKPSTGVVSNAGQFPLFDGILQDFLVTGPMCRYAADLLPMLKVMSEDNTKLNLDSPVNFRQLKIYYMEDDGGNPLATPVIPAIRNALRKVLQHFEETYGIKSQKVNFENLKDSFSIWAHKMGEADAPAFAEEMTGRKGPVNITWEFTKWCFRLSQHTLPAIFLAFLQNVFPGKGSKHSELALKQFDELENQFKEVLDENCVFLYPTHPESAPYHHETIPKLFNIGYTAIFNVLGLPVTHSPVGLCEGMPIGIQIVSGLYNDRLSIAVAVELEKKFGGWTCPGPIL